MESLSETPWDVVIDGTGLQQSLLALALSRSDKKVLHVDSNEYYGGPEAAFSLLEAAEWAKISSEKPTLPFQKVSIRQPEAASSNKLAQSRAYTLTLSPQIIYSKSKLLSQLVSSQVYRQLEFQAVGNWWIYSATSASDRSKILKRMPNGREDIFSDRSIDVRAKRGLMKFLKFVIDFENQPDLWTQHAECPLDGFLASKFQLPEAMQQVIGALTLSLDQPSQTTVKYALPRIARHLTSIGVFGPGFGSVVPKWGGGAEIAQVSCRAGAVGGAIYALGTELSMVPSDLQKYTLSTRESISTTFCVRSQDHPEERDGLACLASAESVARSVNIISSDLAGLFKTTVEGAPSGAVSVVAFPSGSLDGVEGSQYPVYIMAHCSETGECPQNQCVLYASTRAVDNPQARLNAAVTFLLETAPVTEGVEHKPEVLYELFYEQRRLSTKVETSDTSCMLPSSSLDLAFDDETLDNVETAWRSAMSALGEDLDGVSYMAFKPREQFEDDDE